MKKNTRDYGKVDPVPQERADTRAGENDSDYRWATDRDLWMTRKDPYSSQEEVDPPADDDGRGRMRPEDIRKRGQDDI